MTELTLQDIYGCPDCDDGGAAWVVLTDDKTEQRHTYEWGTAPVVLADIDVFAKELMVALRTCTATAELVLDSGCTTE